MKEEVVKKILSDTEKGYNLIADKFSQTRNRIWKELGFIGKFAKEDGRVLDFGCGNGRLLDVLSDKDIDYVGLDVSGELISLAKKNNKDRGGLKGINFLKIDNDFRHLPFPTDFFDTIYSIAVFHHIPGKNKRLYVAQELRRLLKRDGYLIVTVWDLWKAGHKKEYRKNILRNWKDKMLMKSELDFNDCYISFTDNRGKRFDRFHHAFSISTLRKLFEKAGFKVINCKAIGGNIVLLAKKI